MVGPTFLYDLEVGLEGQKDGKHWSKRYEPFIKFRRPLMASDLEMFLSV